MCADCCCMAVIDAKMREKLFFAKPVMAWVKSVHILAEVLQKRL
jgi:hypothetical protein